MAEKLVNTNTQDNIPDEKKGNNSVNEIKKSWRGNNKNNKRAVGNERNLRP